jgi:hypothetical protein
VPTWLLLPFPVTGTTSAAAELPEKLLGEAVPIWVGADSVEENGVEPAPGVPAPEMDPELQAARSMLAMTNRDITESFFINLSLEIYTLLARKKAARLWMNKAPWKLFTTKNQGSLFRTRLSVAERMGANNPGFALWAI